jgi:phosphate transport system protein
MYVAELKELQDDLLMLGSMAMQAVHESVEILRRQDLTAAQALIDADERINSMRYAIESKCLTLIATQQPMAGDLRLLAGVLEIVTELERIADYGKGIARITQMLGHEPLVKPLIDIPAMRDKVIDMLGRSLDAFVNGDVEVARALPQEDDVVDDLYNQIQREVLELLMEKPSLFDRANYLLWAAHNLERAGDRVTNICERVIFTATGELVTEELG